MSDYRAVPALLDIPVTAPKAMLADKGYDGDSVRETLLVRGILPIIPPKANRRDPAPCDYRRYRDRNHVERLFNRLKQSRRIATRYDKTSLSFVSFLCLASASCGSMPLSTGPGLSYRFVGEVRADAPNQMRMCV